VAKVGRRYIALVAILLVVSTALTVGNSILSKRPSLDLLVLEGPDSLFVSVQRPRTVSVAVRAERDLGNLEFRFRCLLQGTLPPGVAGRVWRNVTMELLSLCPAVHNRLEYFSGVGAEELVTIREVSLTNRENQRLILVDFGEIYSAIFPSEQDNESLTTFALIINASGYVVGYYEGYSELFTAKEYLLELARIEAGGDVREYLPLTSGSELSIERDLPPFGNVSFSDARKGDVFGVTLVVKQRLIDVPKATYETKVAAPSFLELVETFADGELVKEASAYWVILNGRTEE